MTKKSIRNFAYASLLALSALTFTTTLASAQEAHGNFTLTHNVRWQNAAVPAGEYKFSIESRGPSEMLVLRKVSGESTGFMILVNDTDAAPYTSIDPVASGKLTVVSQSGARYVSSMELPALGMTLHFAVPTNTRELALSTGAPASSSK
jgi:hypothetical protein